MSYISSIPISSMHHSIDQQPERRGAPELNVSVVVIIALLVAAFALSGCLHLVARWCFGRRQNADAESVVNFGSMRGPLQHVHDTGVDQSAIDALPVFLYKSLKGVEESNDCAVCLSEFQPDDKLRLLPYCSHAFHIDCIGTWLYAHSTCPLCRQSVLSDIFVMPRLFGILGDSYRSGSEMMFEGEERIERSDPRLSRGLDDSFSVQTSPRTSPTQFYSHKRARSEKVASHETDKKNMLIPVQLGRFKTASGGEASSRQRRCYSMGSYEYVLNVNDLQVPLSPLSISGVFLKRHYHRPAFSECIPEFKYEEFRPPPADNNRAALKRKQMSIEFDLPVAGDSTRANVDDKADVKFETSPSPQSVKERLLSKMWPLSAPKSPASEASSSTRGRTFSFRLPRPERKIKASQKRRCLSEPGLESVVCVSAPSTTGTAIHGSGNEAESSNGRLPSFRKWALNWLRI